MLGQDWCPALGELLPSTETAQTKRPVYHPRSLPPLRTRARHPLELTQEHLPVSQPQGKTKAQFQTTVTVKRPISTQYKFTAVIQTGVEMTLLF